jgi:hypothetical protein
VVFFAKFCGKVLYAKNSIAKNNLDIALEKFPVLGPSLR